MIELLNRIDTQLFLWLNSFHNPFFDNIMWLASGKLTWLPLYFIFLVFLIIKYKKDCWLPILGIALVILLSDQISSGLIKPLAERLRPSHEPSLQGLVHLVNAYKGGKYGFVSSHAANSFGLAVFFVLLVRRRWFTVSILIWAAIVSYSRVYLGVHYPGDIIGGALVGSLSALLVSIPVQWAFAKRKNHRT